MEAQDPITIEVVSSALVATVEEMAEALIRSAHSNDTRERRDCCTGLLSPDGLLLALWEGIPIHLGTLERAVPALISRYPVEELSSGDLFLLNDPYSGGGTHLPDMLVVTPIMHGRELLGFAANAAHHADFADRGADHIFQEGLRIAPTRLARAGTLDQNVLQLFLLNCQEPGRRLGDLRAQIGANRIGVRRVLELWERYGAETVQAAAAALLRSSEESMRRGLAAIAPGVYHARDCLDNLYLDETLELAVTVTVKNEEVIVAFPDAPPQVRAPLNLVESALRAAAYYALKTLIDPGLLPNSGMFRPISTLAPPGSIFNCTPPAAVGSRTQTGQRVVDLIYAALAPVLPLRVTAAHNGANTALYLSGVDPRTGRFYSFLETYGGGFGARAAADGLSGVQVHLTNAANLPVERLEVDYPLVVERYELVQDSGGPGRHRGGLGIHRRIRICGHDARYRLMGTRQKVAPWGLFGGKPGGRGRFEVERTAPASAERDGVLHDGDAISVITPGAGGYGPPAERAREQVLQDLVEGRISGQSAREEYGLCADEVRAAGLVLNAHEDDA